MIRQIPKRQPIDQAEKPRNLRITESDCSFSFGATVSRKGLGERNSHKSRRDIVRATVWPSMPQARRAPSAPRRGRAPTCILRSVVSLTVGAGGPSFGMERRARENPGRRQSQDFCTNKTVHAVVVVPIPLDKTRRHYRKERKNPRDVIDFSINVPGDWLWWFQITVLREKKRGRRSSLF